jgi:hypothetical protein
MEECSYTLRNATKENILESLCYYFLGNCEYVTQTIIMNLLLKNKSRNKKMLIYGGILIYVEKCYLRKHIRITLLLFFLSNNEYVIKRFKIWKMLNGVVLFLYSNFKIYLSSFLLFFEKKNCLKFNKFFEILKIYKVFWN